MGDHDISRRIRRVVFASSGLRLDFATLADDDDLYAAGLKSLAALHVMHALEEEFEVEFPDNVLDRANFASLAGMRETIRPLLQGCHDPVAGHC
jgi:acyl carrier protein